MIFFKPSMAALAGAALISGCTSSDKFANTLETRGLSGTQMAANYEKGTKLVAKGNDNVEEGNDQIKKGRDQVSEGEQLKANSKAEYCALAGTTDPDCA